MCEQCVSSLAERQHEPGQEPERTDQPGRAFKLARCLGRTATELGRLDDDLKGVCSGFGHPFFRAHNPMRNLDNFELTRHRLIFPVARIRTQFD